MPGAMLDEVTVERPMIVFACRSTEVLQAPDPYSTLPSGKSTGSR